MDCLNRGYFGGTVSNSLCQPDLVPLRGRIVQFYYLQSVRSSAVLILLPCEFESPQAAVDGDADAALE
jgi:hypothetical protein